MTLILLAVLSCVELSQLRPSQQCDLVAFATVIMSITRVAFG